MALMFNEERAVYIAIRSYLHQMVGRYGNTVDNAHSVRELVKSIGAGLSEAGVDAKKLAVVDDAIGVIDDQIGKVIVNSAEAVEYAKRQLDGGVNNHANQLGSHSKYFERMSDRFHGWSHKISGCFARVEQAFESEVAPVVRGLGGDNGRLVDDCATVVALLDKQQVADFSVNGDHSDIVAANIDRRTQRLDDDIVNNPRVTLAKFMSVLYVQEFSTLRDVRSRLSGLIEENLGDGEFVEEFTHYMRKLSEDMGESGECVGDPYGELGGDFYESMVDAIRCDYALSMRQLRNELRGALYAAASMNLVDVEPNDGVNKTWFFNEVIEGRVLPSAFSASRRSSVTYPALDVSSIAEVLVGVLLDNSPSGVDVVYTRGFADELARDVARYVDKIVENSQS